MYDKAIANAWADVQKTLKALTEAEPTRKLQLWSVSYDPLPGESVIEELPEQPKSSRPQAVTVAIRLRAVYLAR